VNAAQIPAVPPPGANSSDPKFPTQEVPGDGTINPVDPGQGSSGGGGTNPADPGIGTDDGTLVPIEDDSGQGPTDPGQDGTGQGAGGAVQPENPPIEEVLQPPEPNLVLIPMGPDTYVGYVAVGDLILHMKVENGVFTNTLDLDVSGCSMPPEYLWTGAPIQAQGIAPMDPAQPMRITVCYTALYDPAIAFAFNPVLFVTCSEAQVECYPPLICNGNYLSDPSDVCYPQWFSDYHPAVTPMQIDLGVQSSIATGYKAYTLFLAAGIRR